METIKGTIINFTGWPIPSGDVLVCPHCSYWKMYQVENNPELFKCAGLDYVPDGYDKNKYVTCGKVTSKLEIELYIAQMMVKE